MTFELFVVAISNLTYARTSFKLRAVQIALQLFRQRKGFARRDHRRAPGHCNLTFRFEYMQR